MREEPEDEREFEALSRYQDQTTVKVEMVKPRTMPLSKAEKGQLEKLNRERLEIDLRERRLVYSSMPRVVELQLSNFCNMSCTMCYDGVNPPIQKLPQALVDSLAEQLFPWASVFIPFATSEPLIVTWDHTRKLAELYRIELEITTNVQFLDAKKFKELEPHVSIVEFSIDSHLKDIYDSIRLKSRSDKVFENLPVAAKLCREHGIHVLANIVFMTKNAPYIEDTVAFLADCGIPSVHIQKLFYIKPESYFEDAAIQFKPEWIENLKLNLAKIAQEKQIQVLFDFDGSETVGKLPEGEAFRETKAQDPWLESLRRSHPGYCPQSVYRLKIGSEGNAHPCCVGVGEQLKLGNVYENTLEEMWNGPSQQDLRRGMLTDDVPALCVDCNFRTGPVLGEVLQMPFNDEHVLVIESYPQQRQIDMSSPAHMRRKTEPPLFQWVLPEVAGLAAFDRYEIVLSAGGESVDFVIEVDGPSGSYQMPAEDWARLSPNLAYWWTVYAIQNEDLKASLRGKVVRCLIRHEAMERIPGSKLQYSDQG